MLLSSWPPVDLQNVHSVARWPKCQQLYLHVTFLENKYNEEYLNNFPDVKFQYAKLLYSAGWWQHERGNSHTILPILNKAHNLCESCEVTPESQDLLNDIHYGLGAIANETNDGPSCLRHNIKFLAMRLQIGTAWMTANDLETALKSFANAIKTYRSLPATDFPHGHYIVAKMNLGLCNWLNGDLVSAAALFEEAIEERAAIYGPMDTESFRPGRLWYGLGNVRASQGRFDDSEDCHKRALHLFRKSIGRYHHRTADITHRVAQYYMRHGKLDRAEKFVTQALHVWSADKSNYEPEIARTTFLKSKILRMQGQIAVADSLVREAAQARDKILSLRAAEAAADDVVKTGIRRSRSGGDKDGDGDDSASSGSDDRLHWESHEVKSANIKGKDSDVVEEHVNLSESLEEADFDELVTFWSR